MQEHIQHFPKQGAGTACNGVCTPLSQLPLPQQFRQTRLRETLGSFSQSKAGKNTATLPFLHRGGLLPSSHPHPHSPACPCCIPHGWGGREVQIKGGRGGGLGSAGEGKVAARQLKCLPSPYPSQHREREPLQPSALAPSLS